MCICRSSRGIVCICPSCVFAFHRFVHHVYLPPSCVIAGAAGAAGLCPGLAGIGCQACTWGRYEFPIYTGWHTVLVIMLCVLSELC